jgi:hypothetical protein
LSVLSFSQRLQLVDRNGMLTREGMALMVELVSRSGGTTGTVNASSIDNTPNGSIAAVNVQAAIDELDSEKQPKDATLTALAGVATAADRLIYATGSDAFAVTVFTAFARTLLDDANASAARSTLGLGSIATQDASNVGITGGTMSGVTMSGGSITGANVALASGSLGYASGNGGTVTQTLNKTNGVTLNERCGEITTDSSGILSGGTVSFTFTNSTIAATDLLIMQHVSGGTVGNYQIDPVCAAGSATINITNRSGGLLTDALVLRFAVIKAATT